MCVIGAGRGMKISNGVIRYNLITTLRTEAALSECIKIKHTAEIVGAR